MEGALLMVKKERRERLTAAELRLLGQNPNLVTRRIPRPTAKKFTLVGGIYR